MNAATTTFAKPQLIAPDDVDPKRDFSTLSFAALAFRLLTVLAIATLIPAIQTVRSGTGRPRADALTQLAAGQRCDVIFLSRTIMLTFSRQRPRSFWFRHQHPEKP